MGIVDTADTAAVETAAAVTAAAGVDYADSFAAASAAAADLVPHGSAKSSAGLVAATKFEEELAKFEEELDEALALALALAMAVVGSAQIRVAGAESDLDTA